LAQLKKIKKAMDLQSDATLLTIDPARFDKEIRNPFALSLSKGFDKACPEPVEGLSPDGVHWLSVPN
jgi:hypothetical protein